MWCAEYCKQTPDVSVAWFWLLNPVLILFLDYRSPFVRSTHPYDVVFIREGEQVVIPCLGSVEDINVTLFMVRHWCGPHTCTPVALLSCSVSAKCWPALFHCHVTSVSLSLPNSLILPIDSFWEFLFLKHIVRWWCLHNTPPAVDDSNLEDNVPCVFFGKPQLGAIIGWNINCQWFCPYDRQMFRIRQNGKHQTLKHLYQHYNILIPLI